LVGEPAMNDFPKFNNGNENDDEKSSAQSGCAKAGREERGIVTNCRAR
jgi:hypothetical protein